MKHKFLLSCIKDGQKKTLGGIEIEKRKFHYRKNLILLYDVGLLFSKLLLGINLGFKRMQRCFLRIPPLKKILQYQDRIWFFVRNTKKQLLFSK